MTFVEFVLLILASTSLMFFSIHLNIFLDVSVVIVTGSGSEEVDTSHDVDVA